MENVPVEIVLEYLLKLNHKDIKNLCAVNSRLKNICKSNEDYIYKKLLEKEYGNWTKNPKQLFEFLQKKPDLQDFNIDTDQISQFQYIFNLAYNRFSQFEFLNKLHIFNINIIDQNNNSILVKYLNDLDNQDNGTINKDFFKKFEKIIKLGIDINLQNDYGNTVLSEILDMMDSDTHNFQNITELLEILLKYKPMVRQSDLDVAKKINLRKDLLDILESSKVLYEEPNYESDWDSRSIDSRASSSYSGDTWDGY
jgi:hypothetical protein